MPRIAQCGIAHASDLRPLGRTGADTDPRQDGVASPRDTSGRFPAEAPGRAENSKFSGQGRSPGSWTRTTCIVRLVLAACLLRLFPGRGAYGEGRFHLPLRGSAGMGSDRSAPASLFIPSLHQDIAMETVGVRKLACNAPCVKRRRGTAINLSRGGLRLAAASIARVLLLFPIMPFLIRCALAFCVAALPFAAQAGQPYVKVEARLSAEQRHATGLDTLSADLLELLNKLLREDTAKTAKAEPVPGPAITAAPPPRGGGNVGLAAQPEEGR